MVYYLVFYALGFYSAYLLRKIKDVKNIKKSSNSNDNQSINKKVEIDKN